MTSCLQDYFQKTNFKEKMFTPIASMLNAVRQYGLTDMVKHYSICGKWDDVKKIKNQVKKIIWESERQRWKASCLMYKDLWIYNDNVFEIQTHAWWNYVKECPTAYHKVSSVIALLQGCQPKGMIRNISQRYCLLCNNSSLDGPVHILFECDALKVTRDIFWEKIIDSAPIAMGNELNTISSRGKLIFIISGLKCNIYVKEWRQVYDGAACFVYNIYKKRAALYDSLDNSLNVNM